jgi:hypothetical protein
VDVEPVGAYRSQALHFDKGLPWSLSLPSWTLVPGAFSRGGGSSAARAQPLGTWTAVLIDPGGGATV